MLPALTRPLLVAEIKHQRSCREAAIEGLHLEAAVNLTARIDLLLEQLAEYDRTAAGQ